MRITSQAVSEILIVVENYDFGRIDRTPSFKTLGVDLPETKAKITMSHLVGFLGSTTCFGTQNRPPRLIMDGLYKADALHDEITKIDEPNETDPRKNRQKEKKASKMRKTIDQKVPKNSVPPVSLL